MAPKKKKAPERGPENRVVGAKPKSVWSTARCAPARRGDVPRREMVESLRKALLDDPRIAILSAAPGMGKTVLAEALRDEWLAEGRGAISTYLGGLEAGRAISRLNTIARSHTRKEGPQKGALVLIDELPAGDDYQVEKMALLVRKLIASGRAVVITLRPEAEQICEFFPEALCLRSAELAVAYEDRHAWGGAAGGASERDFASATQGMAALVDALRSSLSDRAPFEWDARSASGALAEMASLGIRSTLMDEERRIRLAMMLLGEAGFDALERAVPRVDDAILAGLEREEPFFGVDSATASFRCAGLRDERILGACLGTLRAYAAEEPEIVKSVCGVLGASGRIRRMATVAEGLLPPAARSRLMMRWPAELVDAGLVSSLRTAVSHFDEAEVNAREHFRLGVSKIVLSCISGRTEGCAEIRAALGYPLDERDRRMLAQADAFMAAFAGAEPAPPAQEQGRGDAIAEDLLSHALICSLIFQGDFEEAYRQAVLNGALRAGDGLTSSLLYDDLSLTRLLTGDAKPESQGCSAFGAFLMRPGYRSLRSLRRALFETACAARGLPCDEDAIDEGLSAARARGDGGAAAAFLIAGAARDLTGGAFARALVRSEQAEAFASAAGWQHLALEARTLAALAERCAGGGRIADDELMEAAARTHPECALALALAGGDLGKARASAEALADGGLRASALPLLRCVERLSRRKLIPRMPKLAGPWAHALAALPSPQGKASPVPAELPAWTEGEALIEAEVMDIFSVRVGGEPVAESAWKRQSARTLLALLCTVKGHELSRASICSLIWPDRDYSVARASLYSALSALKGALGQRADGPQPIVVRDGRVILDPTLVSSDVDRLVSIAGRMLLQKDDDASLVERGRELERLKPEKLPCVEADPTGIMVARQGELSALYTDALLVGGEAALRMGLSPIAIRFALEAAAFDPMREDAELLVLRSFSAAGRETEARAHYERFARRLIEFSAAPPSPMMRREAARICGRARRLNAEPRVDDAVIDESADAASFVEGPEL